MNACPRDPAGLGVLTDDRLVSMARRGDRSAFDELVRRHAPRVRALARAMLRDAAEADDVVQETFLSAWSRLDSFRGDSPFVAWIRSIATNRVLMRLRSWRRRPEVLSRSSASGDPADPDAEDLAPSAVQRIEAGELEQALREGLDRLPDNYRVVYEMAEVEQLAMKEIASRLGLSVPNVKTRLHRARLRLRDHLGAWLVVPAPQGA